MKMSEKLKKERIDIDIYESIFGPMLKSTLDEDGEYIRYCNVEPIVDCHDELVGALEGLIEANKCKELPSPHWVANRQAKAQAILNKAKGLDK